MTNTMPLLIVAPSTVVADHWARDQGLHFRAWRSIISMAAIRKQRDRDIVIIHMPGWHLHPELTEYLGWLRANRPDMRFLDSHDPTLFERYRSWP